MTQSTCSLQLHHTLWPFVHYADALSAPSHRLCTVLDVLTLLSSFSPEAATGGPPSGPLGQPVSEERSGIHHALMHAVTADDLRWHRAEGIDACAGITAPHNWCIMLPLSQRVQPGVYTLMALSRYRDALVRHAPPAEPWVYPPLILEGLTSCFDVLVLPPAALSH